MIIAVASGKGGTGKTMISVALAQTMGKKACLFDCDVEEPNAHIFLKGKLISEKIVTLPFPVVDEARCDNCGKCADFCSFNAISCTGGKPVIYAEMCHSCGGCFRVCPNKAISEEERRIGTIQEKQNEEITYVQGTLDVGLPLAPPLIDALKKTPRKEKHIILDSPPGTSCPFIATIKDADYVVLATEATPFGLHDLKLAIAAVKELKLPFGIIINRTNAQNTPTHAYCQKEKCTLLGEIPNDRRIAESYAHGQTLIDALPEYQGLFSEIAQKIVKNGKRR